MNDNHEAQIELFCLELLEKSRKSDDNLSQEDEHYFEINSQGVRIKNSDGIVSDSIISLSSFVSDIAVACNIEPQQKDIEAAIFYLGKYISTKEIEEKESISKQTRQFLFQEG